MSAVRNEQRFAQGRRCPICDGADRDPRGSSRRCSGYVSSDGTYAHCSREEQAGTLPLEDNGTTYAHRLAGPCRCGAQHGEATTSAPAGANVNRRIVETYPYKLEDGTTEFEVVRYEPKDFRQRREANGKWEWSIGQCRRVLYHLPELLAADPNEIVFLVEGEKDVHAMERHGFIATTSPGGADQWRKVDDGQPAALLGRNVIVIPDRDIKGEKYLAAVSSALKGHARSVRVCRLPEKDASDWFTAGHTADELRDIVASGLDEEFSKTDERDLENLSDTDRDVSERLATRFQIVHATADWVTHKLPPREHLLVDARTGRGALDKTGVWIAAGAGGAGKSFALIGLGLAVVNGSTWVGTFKTNGHGRVLILAAEDSVEDIQRRVHAIAAADNLRPGAMERFDVLPLSNQVTSLVAVDGNSFAPSEDTKALCSQLAADKPYDLVIVDPYGRIAGVSVDADNAAAAATISALAMISAAARGLVLGVTHTSMRARIAARNGAAEGSTGVRGATGQTDYARGVIMLEKDDDAIWLSLAKANHVAKWDPVALQRGEHGELLAMDAMDLAKIKAAKSSDSKSAKRAADASKRCDDDDEAARKAMADNPGASVRTLRALVCKARGCGKDRADDAISRCRS